MAVDTRLCAVPSVPEALRGVASYGAELLAEDDGEDAFIVDPLIGADDVVLVCGREKESCKTWLALFLAVSVILGKSWLGFHVERLAPRFVLFVSAETSKRNIARRLRAICTGIGVPVERVAPYLVVIDKPVTMIPRAERERVSARKYNETKLAGVKSFDAERSKALLRSAQVLADAEAASLGQNLDLLQAIEEAGPDVWGLVILDTLRECLEGDDNSSKDGGRFMQAARALARTCRCPVVPIHHNNKSGDESNSRSARGTTALTASPDVIITLDTSGASLTAHFTCRNVASPSPVGYEVVSTADGGMRLEVRDASTSPSKGADGITVDDVMAVFHEKGEHGLTLNSVRELVQKARGGTEGSKANPGSIRKLLATLTARGAISTCTIETSKGKTFDGWVLGSGGGVVAGVPLRAMGKGDDGEEPEANPFKAPRLPGSRK